LSQNGVFTVQGDMILPETTSGNNVTILSSNPGGDGTNATLEVFGDLLVNGLTNITVDNVVVHGNLIISSTGNLWLESSVILIHGNINTQGDIAIVGNNTQQQSKVNISGSLTANGVQNITFVGCVVSVGRNQSSQGSINAPGTTITIGALTITTIDAALTAQSVLLRMDPIDKGQSHFKTYPIVQTTSPINFPVTFEQDWTCGDYKVNATISTNSGISVTLSGEPLTVAQTQYCCFETCYIPSGCTEWICDTVGFIVGWIIGGIIAASVLIVSCTLFARDFISVVKQK